MTWNNQQELYLKHLGEQSMAYTWMQEQTASFYIKLNRTQGICIIILSGIIGTNSFITEELTTRNVIFGIMGYLVSILGMLDQFLKPLEDSQQRMSIGNKFQDIYYDIKQQLAKPPEERKPAGEYLEIMTERFIELYDFAPNINGFIINRFKKNFKDSKIAMPLNANFIDEIKIFNKEPPKSEVVVELSTTKPKDKRHKHNEFQNFVLSRLNNAV